MSAPEPWPSPIQLARPTGVGERRGSRQGHKPDILAQKKHCESLRKQRGLRYLPPAWGGWRRAVGNTTLPTPTWVPCLGDGDVNVRGGVTATTPRPHSAGQLTFFTAEIVHDPL